MVKESTQNALERVFPQLKKESLHMSQQAFSKARQKIKWEAFEELFRTSVVGSYNEEWKLWRGYRLLAIDGSFLRMPSDAALLAYFGGLGPGQATATALWSLLYDLENNIIVDAKLVSIHEHERALAESHLRALQGMDSFNSGHRELIVFDRGYPSHDFLKSLSGKGIAYVMRAKQDFIHERDMPANRDGWALLGKERQRVRVIRLCLPTGEDELLITNLTEKEMEYGAFQELYHKRWGIETKYKALKQKLETENFSGRLVDNVKQDFYAMLTVANMLASCIRRADQAAGSRR
jgi:hypothetical protein